MLALQASDVCYASLWGNGAFSINGAFSTDGIQYDEITPAMVREVFDFNIVKRENFDVNGRLVPGQWHLEREADNAIIPSASVGVRFEPIQHWTVLEYVLDNVVPSLKDAKILVAGTMYGCGVGLLILRLGSEFALAGDESPQVMTLVFNNPTNGMGRMTLGMTAMRMYCLNQIVAITRSAGENGLSVMHTRSGCEIALFAMNRIQEVVKNAHVMRERMTRLSMASVNAAVVEYCLNRVYPLGGLVPGSRVYKNVQRLREGVIREFEEGATARTMNRDSAWKLFNSFTHSIFNPERKRATMDSTAIQYSGMFGTRADSVHKILEAVEASII